MTAMHWHAGTTSQGCALVLKNKVYTWSYIWMLVTTAWLRHCYCTCNAPCLNWSSLTCQTGLLVFLVITWSLAGHRLSKRCVRRTIVLFAIEQLVDILQHFWTCAIAISWNVLDHIKTYAYSSCASCMHETAT